MDDFAAREASMEGPTAIAQAKDIIDVRRVFGEPIERDGLTIVPVAAALGGLGGTTDNPQQPTPAERGRPGSGLLLGARPLGVYVIGHGRVRWRPVVDWNRAMRLAAGVAVAVALARRPSRPGRPGRRVGWRLASPVITSIASPNPHLSWRRSILASGRRPGRHK
jgi:uncharacterized spore protein YtfJ